MNDSKEILSLLNQILSRLDSIESTLSRPKIANLNRKAPKLQVITKQED